MGTFGLMPRCECGKSYTQHLKGRGCEHYKARKGLAQTSESQDADQEILNDMRTAHKALQHELYGGATCEAARKVKGVPLLKHMCQGNLVLDHVELKATRALKFAMTNTQILCEVANGMKGSKRTDFRTAEIKTALAERWPDGWPLDQYAEDRPELLRIDREGEL